VLHTPDFFVIREDGGGWIECKMEAHLVHQSSQVRLDYFKAYTLAHPALKQADQAVWNALREPAGASLIFVFGPTGSLPFVC
jgi:hypothetical protein